MQGIISWLFDNSLSKDKKICSALITKCFFFVSSFPNKYWQDEIFNHPEFGT